MAPTHHETEAMHSRILLLSLTLAFSASATTVTYTDGTLAVANYNILQGSSPGASVAFSNVSGTFVADRSIGSGGGFVGFAAINPSFSYDPSMGTLDSIDVSALISTSFSLWAFYVLQGSDLYRVSVNTGSGTAVPSSATGILAANFALVNLGAGTISVGTPNFAAGFTMGFGQRVSASGALADRIAFDDLSITLNLTNAAVPEPSTLALCGGAALAALLVKRTSKRSA
jgi:hypothetical protein